MSNKKEKMLLIEACEFAPQVTVPNDLKESIKLAPGKNDTLIVRNVPCTILNRKNLNGRIYSTEVVQQAINEAQEKIKQKQLLSQACEHPEGSFVSPTTASHVVVNAYIKPNTRLKVEGEESVFDVLFMDLEVLNTQEGKNLRALLEAGCSVGTSIRGLGDMEGDQVVEYDLLGVDIVGQPSSSTYTNMPIAESVKVEAVNSKKLDEAYILSTSSTNTVRDLSQAAAISAKLDEIGYGTVSKTSTKVDEETNPKTGATTTLVTLEAETNDELTDLNQALVMAKKAMLNPLVHVDSITIENVEEEGDETKESVEVTEDTVKKDGKWVNKGSEGTHGKFDTKKAADAQRKAMFANGYGESEEDTEMAICAWCGEELPKDVMSKEKDLGYICDHCKKGIESRGEELYVSEAGIKEAVDDKANTKPRKFVLKTQNGYVAMNGNAINFVKKPSEAIQFVEGKEDSGMVHLSNIEKILDTMGIYDVEKYYKREGVQRKKEQPKEEGLVTGDINVSTGDIASGNDLSLLPENNALDGTPIVNYAGQPQVNMSVKEDTSSSKYVAIVSANGGKDQSSTPITATEAEGVLAEVSNLYEMKQKSLGDDIRMTIQNTETGDSWLFNPANKSLDPIQEALSDDTVTVNDNKVTMKADEDTEITKEFDNKQQAELVKAGIDSEKIDPAIMIKEDADKRYLVGFKGPNGWIYIVAPDDEYDQEHLEIIDREELENLKAEGVKLWELGFFDKQAAEDLVHELSTEPGFENSFNIEEIDVNDDLSEKLYKNPDEASDPYIEKPLKDAAIDEAGEDDSVDVIIHDIDWNIDSFGEDNNDVQAIIDTIERLPEEIRFTVHASDFMGSNNVKNSILAKASEEKDLPQIKDAEINVVGLTTMSKNNLL